MKYSNQSHLITKVIKMPEDGEIKRKGNKTFMWDSKHEKWINVTPPPNYEQLYVDALILK
jgi:hypothetical protein